MKSILLHAYDDLAFDARLAVALDCARTFSAHLTCLQTTPYEAYMAFDPLGGAMPLAPILKSLGEREAAFRKRIEAHLEREDVPWDWIQIDGDPAMSLVHAASLADLLVLSQADATTEQGRRPLSIIEDVATHADCATFMVPRGVRQFDPGGPIVLAWNDSTEAGRAIRLALPFIKQASLVHIVSVEEEARFPQTAASSYLARHGVFSELHALKGGARPDLQILGLAAETAATSVVMGAFGHARLRETLLGGVTRRMLDHSTVPLIFG